MPDGFSAVVQGVGALQKELARIDKSVDRATMWGVRQAGRQVKQEAKRAAPVLKGKAGQSRKEFAAGGANRPVRGLLRASIHSSKQLKRTGPGEYAVTVAPRGQRVHLYAGKVEAKHNYMHRGYEAVAPRLAEIVAGAWAKATRGRR